MNDRYMVTYTGKQISLSKGLPDTKDIAISMCRCPMYAGHTKFFMSVAHHVMAASHFAYDDMIARGEKRVNATKISFLALTHEMEVTYFGDIPGPVKCTEQRVLERLIRKEYYKTLDIEVSEDDWARVEYYDKAEQAASCRVYGLKETVYDSIWNQVGSKQKEEMILLRDINHLSN